MFFFVLNLFFNFMYLYFLQLWKKNRTEQIDKHRSISMCQVILLGGEQ
jgi:hypothetical protein